MWSRIERSEQRDTQVKGQALFVIDTYDGSAIFSIVMCVMRMVCLCFGGALFIIQGHFFIVRNNVANSRNAALG